MRHFVIPEFGRIPKQAIGNRLLRRLQAFDERHSKTTGSCVLDWDHVSDIRAMNYVGVVQVPGVTIEILPKVDSSEEDRGPYGPVEPQKTRAQQNLLYMLSFTKKIPVLPRDIAGLRLQKMHLLDALVSVFVGRLLLELKRGLDHCYVRHEENLPCIKGKLLVSQHVRLNAAHKERAFVGFDEFVSDTWLNRILKAACRRLLDLVQDAGIQQRLRESLLFFADVKDCRVQKHDHDKVLLNRNTERFTELLGFAWMVLLGSSPTPSTGATRTFSLLFPMERLFEEFIARFIRRKCDSFELARESIRVQTAHRCLLKASDGTGRFRLKPDIIITRRSGNGLILDTKWKRLKADVEDAKNGVNQADLYQLYAYAHRYACPDNVLLFPAMPGASRKTYNLAGEEDKRMRIEFVDLNRDYPRQQDDLVADLRQILSWPV